MKVDKLASFFCAAALSFCLGLGAVASMATGLELSVSLPMLALCCGIAALAICGCLSFRYGFLIPLSLGAVLHYRLPLLLQLKTIAAAVMERLTLGYGLEAPLWLTGDMAEDVLFALLLLAEAVIFLCGWAVIKQKTALPAVLVSLLPLGCCITVVDTVPHPRWLFLWGLGLVLLLMTQSARKNSHRQGNRLTALLALPVVGVLLLLFFLVPTDAPECWNLPDFSQGLFDGPPAETEPPRTNVDLSDLTDNVPDQKAVMEVTADFSGLLYLRARDYDQYTGTGWSSTESRVETLVAAHSEHRGEVRIQVRNPGGFYYVPSYPSETLTLSGGYAPNPNGETDYTFSCSRLTKDWDAHLMYYPNQEGCNPRFFQLPNDTRAGVAPYLNTTNLISLTEHIEQIRKLVSGHAAYDLKTPNMPQGETDLALWFLEDSDTGYCVHFATTAAVLLRAQGIPARYVEGYLIEVEKGKTVKVLERHAHAWVEYFAGGAGWIILEATPSVATEPEATEPPEVPTTAPTTPTAAEHPKPQAGKRLSPVTVMLLQSVAAVSAVWLLFWGQYRLRRCLLRRKLERGNANQRCLALYRQLERISAFLDQPIPEEITALAQEARFSHHTLTDRQLQLLLNQLVLGEASIKNTPLYRRIPAKWCLNLY